ncbi:mitochondrial dicarboxylate carrier, putative [Cordyceps militaris CM01]|uniref:Mitochondrial dicarboxylate carrier, putative n=1 Tax=Cordyceps militaris (strain CM01) TaxID=983644 RepID=G3JET8_CORMM|nr:mitochondrial dicarboxylate carrier, putative [Cordyceps militaris CM01]EGX93047.1 mitochondrial dicarboxylate carrier, putative [Cordyceps militaris CM01]
MSSSAQESASRLPAQTSPKKKTVAPAIRYPFWFGGSASSLAACVTHPLDLVKVRLQTRQGNAPQNMSGTFVHILKNDGLIGLYSGISASLLRQLTYSTVRFGVYEELKTRYTRTGRTAGFPALTAMAMTSGFLGGVAGNFADVLNVRMQHDAALPPAQRRNYKNALDGMVRMARDEGLVSSYFRGWLPNASRAAVMTAGQLATYDTFKRLLLEYTPLGDTMTTHFTASFLAGLAAATATSPIDVIKTRVMSSSKKQGIVQVIGDISRTEGMRWMFKGWVPSFLRLGPHTICTFLFLEAHRKLYRAAKGIDDGKE